MTATWQVKVVDSNGQPIVGAAVDFMPVVSGPTVAFLGLGPEGYFTIFLPQPLTMTLNEGAVLNLAISPSTTVAGDIQFAFTGLPIAVTVQPHPSNPNARVLQWFPTGDDAGNYPVGVRVTDANGGFTDVAFTIAVRHVWGIFEWSYATLTFGPGQSSIPVLRGVVPFDCNFSSRDGIPNGSPDTSIRYVIDTPAGRTAISPVLTNSFTFQWNSSSVPDGTYAISVEVVNGGPDVDRMQPQPRQVVVDNVPGSVVGTQKVPLLGNQYGSKFAPPVTDWFVCSGVHELCTAKPYPAVVSPPVHSIANPDQYLSPGNWFIEPLGHAITTIYETLPTVYATRDGHLYTDGLHSKYGSTSATVYQFVEKDDFRDGQRNRAEVSPFSTYVNDPDSDGWIALDLAGRIVRVAQDGSVTTIVGHILPDATIPKRDGASLAEINAQKTLLGQFIGLEFQKCNDLAFDPNDSKTIYVADSNHNRIAEVDLHGPVPIITTLAGTSSGYVDGPLASAKFSNPYSVIVASDGTVYVGDRGNKAVRAIKNGQVSTVVGSKFPTIPSPIVVSPMVIRFDSRGNIIVGDADAGGSAIFRIDPMAHTVTKIHDIPSGDGKWMWLDVDRYGPANSPYGNVGPKDDILWALTTGGNNTFTGRISADGTRYDRLFGNGLDPITHGLASQVNDGMGHYPWAIAVHKSQSKIIGTGSGSMGVAQARLAVQSDRRSLDVRAFSAGLSVFNLGSVSAFSGNIGAGSGGFIGSSPRPAFDAVHGPRGQSRLGNLPNFDDMAEWSNAVLATYIQAGMGGTVPRPELTGDDLRDLIYFIRRESLAGISQEIDLAAIESDLRAAGHYDSSPTPVIGGVTAVRSGDTITLSFSTSVLAIAVAKYGTTDYVPRYSSVGAFETSHQLNLLRVPSVSIFYEIVARNRSGGAVKHSGVM